MVCVVLIIGGSGIVCGMARLCRYFHRFTSIRAGRICLCRSGLVVWRGLLYIENPRIVRGFSKSFSVASSKSYSFRVRLDCGPSTAIKTLKEAI